MLNIKFQKIILLLLLGFSFSGSIIAQNGVPKDFCITKKEKQLFDLINLIRSDYDKPELQLSNSLSYVAKLHVEDLQQNNPDTSICTLSSWSDKGEWNSCCYNKYVFDPNCMWDKPKELTNFKYRGYELASYFEEGLNPDSVYNLWCDSKEALNMILTNGTYKKKKWLCAGVGISDNYVCLWFAQRKDPDKEPDICKGSNKSDTTAVKKTTNKVSNYYLIFGSFNNMHDAKTSLKEIKRDGYKNCNVLERNGKFRVYLASYGSLKEAMFAQQSLPQKYKESWILKN